MRSLARGIARYCFRLLLFYWICFAFPFPLELVGVPLRLVEPKNQPAWMQAAGAKYGKAYSWIASEKDDACKWVGDRVLHVEVIIQLTGSGDTMRCYVGCFCAFVVAAAAALFWTAAAVLVQKWKPDWNPDRLLHGIVRVIVRFFLCQMLFGYGFAKIFPLQFPEPSSFRLDQPLGEMSPMGLLWTFMGFSASFQIFTGAIEALAGLLLTMRRTTTLGALIAVAAMTHVFMLNMCFDVPVKLYALNYLIMAIFLVAPDLARLIRVLMLGQAVEARPFSPLLGSVKLDRLVIVLRTLLVIAMLYGQVRGSYERWTEMYGGPPPPIAGRWDLASMQVDQKEPEKDDPVSWRWVDFSNRRFVRLAGPKPPNASYLITWEAEAKKLKLTKFRDSAWSATFTYELPEPDLLELQGSLDGKAIAATLVRTAEKRYELMNRGFHWVQEMPYNR